MEPFEVTEWDLQNEFNPDRSKRTKNSKKQATYGIFADSDSDEDRPNKLSAHDAKATKEVNFVPSSSKTIDSDNVSSRPSSSKNLQRFSGMSGAAAYDPNFGAWERGTKGIGSKLLGKMGWQPGQGLGKGGQGIVAPIIAHKRSAPGVGLGAVTEKKQEAVFAGGVQKVKATSSIGSPSTDRVKKTKVFKTIDELVDEDKEIDAISSSTKVIDMRGPESKTFSGYHEMYKTTLGPPTGPAAEVELEILATEKDLVKTFRDMKKIRDRIGKIEDDRNYVDAETRKESRDLDDLLQLASLIKSLRNDDDVDIPAILTVYQKLSRNHSSDFDRLKFRPMMFHLIQPQIELLLKDWRPFDGSHFNTQVTLNTFKSLKKVLCPHDQKMLDILLWNHWMPIFRRKFLKFDSLKDNPDSAIHAIEAWSEVIPSWLLDNLIVQMVIPRLEEEVTKWDPLTDPIPVHTWIHPWLPIIREERHFETIYRSVKQKLGVALSSWHPSDDSAKIILEPWKNILSESSWNAFMSTHIIPKLEEVIRSLIIDPRNQRLDNWTWLMSWQGLLSDAIIANILVKNFFPNWLKILYDWLSSPNPDFEEVSNWYIGWKTMIPPPIAAQQPVQDCLNRGLEMMDFSVSNPLGMSAYVFTPFNPHQQSSAQNQLRDRILSAVHAPVGPSPLLDMSAINFRELVTRKCHERGILFMPINKTFEGKQVYSLGPHHVYLDRSVVFLHNPTLQRWLPVSLETLLG